MSAFGAFTAGTALALPILLNTKKELVTEEKFKGTSGQIVYGVLGGNDLICAKDKNEGFLKQVEVLPKAFGYLGLIHITLEECTAENLGQKIACTGLGDSPETILMLPEIHLVYDSLSPLDAAILFLIPLTHLECPVLHRLLLIEGQLLCLIAPLTLTKKFEIKCEEKSLGDPREVSYWNDAGNAVNIENGLLTSESDEKPNKMASLRDEARIENETLETEIMD
jgi:hypothetical protein